jgi:acetyltransferase-like isoleucine patch superfamily enzyme
VNIVLFGAGSHLSYTAEIIELCGDHKIVGVIDSIKPIGEIVNGYKVIGRQENIEALITEYQIEGGIISVGDNFSRGSIYGDIVFRLPDFEFINAIHPSSVVSKDVEIGVGVIVMAGCIINAGAVLNDFCFLATGAQVEHNSSNAWGNYFGQAKGWKE